MSRFLSAPAMADGEASRAIFYHFPRESEQISAFAGVHHQNGGSDSRALVALLDKNPDVLDQSDHPALNLLTFEPSPAGPFGTVIVHRVGKASFHHVPPSASAVARGRTLRFAAGCFNYGIVLRDLKGTSLFRVGAPGSQGTLGA
jgi:hypothetical protein